MQDSGEQQDISLEELGGVAIYQARQGSAVDNRSHSLVGAIRVEQGGRK